MKSFEDEWSRLQASNAIKALCHRDPKVAGVSLASYTSATETLRSLVRGSDVELRVGDQLSQYGVVDPKLWMALYRTAKFHAKPSLSGHWLEANLYMEKAGWEFFTFVRGGTPLLLDMSIDDKSGSPRVRHVRARKIGRTFNALIRDGHKLNWCALEQQGEVVRRLTSDSSRGDARPESFTWLRKPWRLSDAEFSWQVRVLLRLIPCRWNLKKWKIKPDARCQICHMRAETPVHALNGCKSELRMELYKRRHDAALTVVADILHNKGATFTVDKPFRGSLVNHSFRPDIILYNDSKKTAVSVDVKSPFCGRSFDLVDTRNTSKYAFFDRRLRPHGWSNEVRTLISSSEGIIPLCSWGALLALGFSPAQISETLGWINTETIKAGYKLRKTLGFDQSVRSRLHRYRRRQSI